MNGKGIFIWPDNRKYEGGYKEDKFLNGQMEGNLKGFGKTENKKVKGNFIIFQQKNGKKVLGKMLKDWVGQ